MCQITIVFVKIILIFMPILLCGHISRISSATILGSYQRNHYMNIVRSVWKGNTNNRLANAHTNRQLFTKPISCVIPESESSVYSFINGIQKIDLHPLSEVECYSLVEENCKEGYYKSTEDSFMTCIESGQWTPPISDKTCFKFCPPMRSDCLDLRCTYYGEDVDCANQSRQGTKLKQFCNEEHCSLPHGKIVSQMELECLQDGTWSGELYPCDLLDKKSCSPVISDSLDLTCSINGDIVDCTKESIPGTKLSSSCKFAYSSPNKRAENPVELHCGFDGKWIGELQHTCVSDGTNNTINVYSSLEPASIDMRENRKRCIVPTIEGAVYSSKNITESIVWHPEFTVPPCWVVKVDCGKEYSKSSRFNYMTCLPNGEWSPSPPEKLCLNTGQWTSVVNSTALDTESNERKPCFIPNNVGGRYLIKNLHESIVLSPGTRIDTYGSVKIDCATGYLKNNSDNYMMCLANGTWTSHISDESCLKIGPGTPSVNLTEIDALSNKVKCIILTTEGAVYSFENTTESVVLNPESTLPPYWVVKVDCEEKYYKHISFNYMACLTNGEWYRFLPEKLCSKIEQSSVAVNSIAPDAQSNDGDPCVIPNNKGGQYTIDSLNGSIVLSPGTRINTYGSVKIDCAIGYLKHNSDSYMMCLANGRWTSYISDESCLKIGPGTPAVNLTEIDALSNKVKCIILTTVGAVYSFENTTESVVLNPDSTLPPYWVVKVDCEEEYNKNISFNYMACLTNGKWNQFLPKKLCLNIGQNSPMVSTTELNTQSKIS